MKKWRRERSSSFPIFYGEEWISDALKEAEQETIHASNHSTIISWIKREGWTQEEGIYLLAGLDPKSVIFPKNELMEFPPPDHSEFQIAQPFSQPSHFTLEPHGATSPNAPSLSSDLVQNHAERRKEVNSIIGYYRHLVLALYCALDESPAGLGDPQNHLPNGVALFSPNRFIAWASSFGFKPAWVRWAEANGLIKDDPGPFLEPYFDPESVEYPELLHIAVRAWDHARTLSNGTPKQRVLDYLTERYPNLSVNARDAIAYVANWQREGGRPSKK